MNKDEHDIFDVMQQLSDDDVIKFLEQIETDIEPITDLQKRSIKMNVLKQISTQEGKKTGFKKRIIAACIFALILITGFTSTGQHILAEIGSKLYLIPGIGKVVEKEDIDIYVLEESVSFTENGQETIIKSIIKEGKSMEIRMEGNGVGAYGITLQGTDGVEYESGHSWRGLGHGWIAGYSFYNIPEDLYEFSIMLSKDVVIPITLIKAQSYDVYEDMGPTDIVNGLGLTLRSSTAGGPSLDGKSSSTGEFSSIDDSIRLDLIEHAKPERKVALYGYEDKDSKRNIQILVSDDKGNQYPLSHAQGYSGTLSEFYFQPNADVQKYFIEVPEVQLSYPIDEKVTIPVPSEGEIDIGRSIDMNGFTFDIVKAVREGETVWVYVDTHYDNTQPENINLLHLDLLTDDFGGYSWRYDENIAVDRYEFKINQTYKKVTIVFKEMLTALKGPWKFEIPTE